MWVSLACFTWDLTSTPTDETGEVLGMHVWDEDIFTETGGAFLLCHVSF